jgi:hypothetical protein
MALPNGFPRRGHALFIFVGVCDDVHASSSSNAGSQIERTISQADRIIQSDPRLLSGEQIIGREASLADGPDYAKI